MASKNKMEIILKIGGEGGSLTLIGKKVSGDSWRFRMERDERTIKQFLSEDDLEGISDADFNEKSGWVDSFSRALDLLSRYPWLMLYPLKVHPEFREPLLAEVERRGGHGQVERWTRILERGNIG